MHVNKILAIALLVSGCSTTEPVVQVVTQEVKVPIAVACKEEVPIEPEFCFSKLTEDSNIFDKAKCLLSDREKSKAYQLELSSKLKACK